MRFMATILIVALFPLISSASNEGLTVVGRIVKPDGTALAESNVQFLIQVYGDSTLLGNGTAGSDHCLLYQESQTLDMSNSGGTFNLIIGQGTSPTFGTGVTSLMTVFRNPQTNSPAASEAIGAVSCSSGQTKYLSSSWNNDRQINITVTTSSTVLNLATIPVRSVPFALQAGQVGGYSSDYIMRVQTSRPGSTNNFSANQFDFLLNLGINAVTPGVPSSYQVTNLLANDPTQAQQVATKNYVDTAIAGATTSLPALNSAKVWVGNGSNVATAVSVNGDATMDNTGKITVGGIQTKAVTISGLASKDTLIYNGTAWVNINIPTCTGGQYLTFDGTTYSCTAPSNSPVGSSLNSAQIWVGNSSNVAAPVTMSGDISMTNGGVTSLTKISGTALSVSGLTANQVLQYNGSQWVNATLNLNYLSPTLNDAKIWVGNSGNTATPVSVSGDAALADTGALSVTGIRGVVVSSTAPTSNQVLQYNGSQWVPTSLSATLPSLNDTKIWVGNSSNVPTAVSAGGDVSMDDSGSFTVGKIQSVAVSSTAPTSNQVLQYNGSQWVPATIVTSVTGSALNDGKLWLGNAGNTAQPVSMTGDVTMNDAGVTSYNNTVPVTKGGTGVTSYNMGEIPVYDGTKLTGMGCATPGQVLQWQAGTGFVCTTLSGISPVGSALAAGNIWYGNSSGVAVAGAPSGDVSMSNAGVFKVTQVQAVPVSSTAPTSNQVLQYNGSQWIPTTLNYLSPTLSSNNVWLGNASNIAAPVAVPTCAANNYLTFNGSAFSCNLDAGSTGSVTSIATTAPLDASGSTGNVTLSMDLNQGHIYVGNASNLAADVAMSGDTSISSAGAVTVNKIQNSTVTISSPSANQILQYNGSAWLNVTPTYQSSTLTDAKIWVGNSSNIATGVSVTGDASMVDTGAMTVTGLRGVAVSATAPTSNQVLQYNGSSWVPTSLSATLPSLNDATIWVGNASNAPISVSASGDVSLADTGAFTIQKINGTTVAGVGLANNDVLQNNSGSTLSANSLLVTNGTDTGVTAVVNQNSAVLISSATGVPSWSASATAANQVLQYNGSTWVPTALNLNPTGQTLNSAQIWVGNASNLAAPVAVSGDASISNAGALTVTGIQTTPVTISSLSTNQVLQYNGSKWVNATLSATLPSLADAKIWVGNGSSVASAVSASGDVSMADTGAFTVTGIGGATINGSPSTNQVLQYNGSQWIPTTLSNSPVGSALTSAQIWVGNGGNLAEPVAVGGDASISNAGAVTVNKIQGSTVTITTPSANQILQYNGSAWLNVTPNYETTTLASNNVWLGNASNIAAPVSVPTCAANYYLTFNGSAFSCSLDAGSTGSVTSIAATAPLTASGSTGNVTLSMDLTAGHVYVGNASNLAADVAMSGDTSISNAGAVTVNKIQGSTVTISSPSANQILQYNGSAWLNVTPTYQSSTLTDTKIWVGNSANTAAAVSVAGDASLADTGSMTVTGLRGVAVSATAPTSNQVLQYNGSQWVPATVVTAVTGSALNDGKFWLGNAGNTAQPVSMTGDVTMNDAGVTSYNNTVPVTKGGTGVTTYTLGQIPVYDGTKLTGLGCSAGQVLQWDASNGFICTTLTGISPVGSALAAGNIWYGNSSGVAVAGAPSGDVSMSNAGVFKVTQVQAVPVSSTAPTSNQVLQYNGSQWVPSTLTLGTVISGGTQNVVAIFNAAGTNVVNSSITDNGATGVDFANSKLTFNGSLFAHNDGTKNTFLGIGSGNTSLTGFSNTGIGYNSLNAANNGNGNSALGTGALAANTDGNYNTAMGWNALQLNVTGSSNTAIGQNALNNTTGSSNTAVGTSALTANGSGATNTAIGYQTMNGANGTSYNTAVGSGALTNPGGNYNVAVGNLALSVNTNGTYNTGLGYDAGINITSGNGNVLLGYTAGPSTSGAYNNKLYINNNASNAPLIGGDFSAGYVQINNMLEVPLSSATPTPTAGYGRVYAKADGNLYFKNGTTEYQLSGVTPGGVTSLAATAPLAVSASTGAITASMNLTSGHVYVGNASNLAADVAMSGDTSISNAGAVTVNKIQGSTVTISSPAANQILQYNGSAWLNITPTYQSSTLNDAKLWVGNSGNVATAVSAGGDVSMLDTGAFTVNKIQNSTVTISSPSANQILQYNGSAWLNVTPSYQSTSLASANIWVGNGSGVATAVAPTGDASLSNAGALTVTGIQTTPVTISSLSTNQILQYNGSKWVNVTPTYQSSTLNDAKIWVGNSGNIATAVSAGGDVSMADTGAFTVNKIQSSTVTISTPSANQVLQYNGSAWINTSLSTAALPSLTAGQIWVGNASNAAVGVALSGDVASVSNAGAVTLNTVPVTKGGTGVTSYSLGQIPVYDGAKLTGLGCSVGQVLQWQTGTGFACTSFTGDVTLASSGATTVTALQGRSVASTAPTTGQVLSYNGSAWVPANGATGSGTTNYVPKWTSSSALGNSLIYDNGTNVGIGTTNPGAALDVNGNAAWENNTASSSGPTFSFWKTRNYTALSNNDELGFVSFYGHDGTGIYRSAYMASHVDATPVSATHTVQGRLEFYTTPSGASDSSERMRITSSGTIGIGTTNPGAGLDIATTGTTGSAVIVPRDTTANRPSTPVNGMIRYNSSNNLFEAYENGNWTNMLRGYIGGLTMVAKASCNWTVTTSWGTMAANSNCNALTADGSATSPGKYPAITFANLAPGKYKVTFNIPIENGTNVCVLRITDGTNYGGFAHTSSTQIDNVIGLFTYTTAQTNVTFSLQAKAGAANDCYVYGDGANTGLTPVSDYVYSFYVEKVQ